MDDYNSSDDEMPAPPPNPYASLGKESIENMVARASELRSMSKHNYRLITNAITIQGKAPGTDIKNARWANRFVAYCQSMNLKPDHVPTGQDILRFMDSITQVSRSRYISSDAMSYSWFHGGVQGVLNYCQFKFSDFNITIQDGKRLDMLVSSLINNGLLTKDPFFEEQWLGSCIIMQCASSILDDALTNGTSSWDVTICKAASLILVSALGRVGDVVTSPAYTERMQKNHKASSIASNAKTLDARPEKSFNDQCYQLICLLYEDVTIKITEDANGGVSFAAHIVMKQDKGQKGSRKVGNRTVYIKWQREERFNIMDPVKYILVMALRFGVVEATTIQELIAATLKRVDKTVQWAKPEYPVLPAFKRLGCGVIPDKSAQTCQILRTLHFACDLCGILKNKPRVHDMRRGMARELACLPNVAKLNTREAAEALGHSRRSEVMGVTRAYIGPEMRDVWSARLENMENSREILEVGFKMVPEGFKRKMYSMAQLDQACADHGLDPTNPRMRVRASKILDDEARDRIVERNTYVDGSSVRAAMTEKSTNTRGLKRKARPTKPESAMPIDPRIISYDESTFPVGPTAASINKLRSFMRPDPASMHPSMHAPQLTTYDTGDAGNTGAVTTMPSTEHAGDNGADDPDDDDLSYPINPDVIEIASVISGDNGNPSQKVVDLADALLDFDIDEVSATTILTLPPLQYVDKLSQINIIRSAMGGRRHRENTVAWTSATGGSHGAPTPFQHPCRNAPNGCEATFNTAALANSHFAVCRSISREAHDREQLRLAQITEPTRKQFACSPCGLFFDTEHQWKTHTSDHGWVPQRCDVEGCKSKKVFAHRKNFIRHKAETHDFASRTCDVEGCEVPDNIFQTRIAFKRHLASHGLNSREIVSRMSLRPLPLAWVDTKCRFPDCTSDKLFPNKMLYLHHLRRVHGVRGPSHQYMPGAGNLEEDTGNIDDEGSDTEYRY